MRECGRAGHRVDRPRVSSDDPRRLRPWGAVMDRGPFADRWARAGHPGRTRRGGTAAPGLGLLTAVILGVTVTSACSDSGGSDASTAATGTRAAAAARGQSGSDLESDYQRVIKRVLPSVVEIRTSSGLGSGVIF